MLGRGSFGSVLSNAFPYLPKLGPLVTGAHSTDTLDSTSLNNGSSTVNLGGDLGLLGAASPSAQATWDQAAAHAGLDQGSSADDMG